MSIYGNWESELAYNPEPVNDVQVTLMVRYDDVPRMTYKVRVYRSDGKAKLLDVMYPHGVPVARLPRGAKVELRRVFPLALMMIPT